MLIEFVGCSGAGKTTLANRVLTALTSLGHLTAYSRGALARSTHTDWISNERLRNVLLNGLLLPWFARSLTEHHAFYRFVVPRIYRRAENVIDLVNRTRSTMRLISGDELLKRNEEHRQLTLVDEGSIGSAHNVFAFPHVEFFPERKELMLFAEMVPAPDVIVHIDAPPDLTFQRIHRRGGSPIRRGYRNRRLQHYLAAGRATFDVLAGCGVFGDRVLTITNREENADSLQGATRQIVDFILDHAKRNAEQRRPIGSSSGMHVRKESNRESCHLQ
ncbi:MAG: AAA family ATPase [Planctomycetes bacterium]|nr:AAA family ATPase [Planctomycetota bacterium]